MLHITSYEETRLYLEAFPADKIAVFDERWLREVLYPYRNELEDKLIVVSYPCLDSPARRPSLPFLEVSRREYSTAPSSVWLTTYQGVSRLCQGSWHSLAKLFF